MTKNCPRSAKVRPAPRSRSVVFVGPVLLIFTVWVAAKFEADKKAGKKGADLKGTRPATASSRRPANGMSPRGVKAGGAGSAGGVDENDDGNGLYDPMDMTRGLKGSEGQMMMEMQHRIEALELEKQLLRNKYRDQGGDDDMSDVPLEAYIHSFKIKYARQQAIFDEKTKTHTERIRELESENSVLTQSVQRLTAAHSEMEANFSTVRAPP